MYFPASHAEHTPFMGPVPPSQEQSSILVLPAREVNEDGHAVQTADPTPVLKVPAGQAVQLWASRPV